MTALQTSTDASVQGHPAGQRGESGQPPSTSARSGPPSWAAAAREKAPPARPTSEARPDQLAPVSPSAVGKARASAAALSPPSSARPWVCPAPGSSRGLPRRGAAGGGARRVCPLPLCLLWVSSPQTSSCSGRRQGGESQACLCPLNIPSNCSVRLPSQVLASHLGRKAPPLLSTES